MFACHYEGKAQGRICRWGETLLKALRSIIGRESVSVDREHLVEDKPREHYR